MMVSKKLILRQEELTLIRIGHILLIFKGLGNENFTPHKDLFLPL